MSRGLGFIEQGNHLGGSTLVETLTCAHCGRIFKKPSAKEPSAFCTMCMRATCLPCGGSLRCDPFEKKLERIESRAQLVKAALGC